MIIPGTNQPKYTGKLQKIFKVANASKLHITYIVRIAYGEMRPFCELCFNDGSSQIWEIVEANKQMMRDQ